MPFFILLALALLIAYLFALGFVIVAVSTVAFVPLVLLAAVAAYLFAAVVPLVLLTSERWAQPRSAILTTPAEVVAGNVLGAAPRGEMAYHGWDHAWPNYFPYQAQRDFRFVVAVMTRVSRYFLVLPWRWVRALWNKSDGMARWLWWLPIIIGMVPTIAVPLTFFAVMLVLTSALFVGVLWVVMTVMTAIARLFGFVYGSTERSARRRASKPALVSAARSCPRPQPAQRPSGSTLSVPTAIRISAPRRGHVRRRSFPLSVPSGSVRRRSLPAPWWA